jgi:hypothetical protein
MGSLAYRPHKSGTLGSVEHQANEGRKNSRDLYTATGDERRGMANQPWLNEIASKVDHAQQLYHRLIILIGATGAGSTVAEHRGLKPINVSMQLGEPLLNLSARRRPLQIGGLLEEIVGEEGEEVVLLDHLEILFEKSLKQDPLRLLQGISRSRTVVAVWSGILEDGSLTYAVPGHPEHRRYPATDLLLVIAEASGDADGQA